MHILRTTTDNQILSFIAREQVGIVNIDLYDTNKKETISFSADTIGVDGYLKVSHSYELVEGNFYTFKVFDILGNLIYRGQIFVTDQTDYLNYQMNISGYTTNNDKEEIIII